MATNYKAMGELLLGFNQLASQTGTTMKERETRLYTHQMRQKQQNEIQFEEEAKSVVLKQYNDLYSSRYTTLKNIEADPIGSAMALSDLQTFINSPNNSKYLSKDAWSISTVNALSTLGSTEFNFALDSGGEGITQNKPYVTSLNNMLNHFGDPNGNVSLDNKLWNSGTDQQRAWMMTFPKFAETLPHRISGDYDPQNILGAQLDPTQDGMKLGQVMATYKAEQLGAAQANASYASDVQTFSKVFGQEQAEVMAKRNIMGKIAKNAKILNATVDDRVKAFQGTLDAIGAKGIGLPYNQEKHVWKPGDLTDSGQITPQGQKNYIAAQKKYEAQQKSLIDMAEAATVYNTDPGLVEMLTTPYGDHYMTPEKSKLLANPSTYDISKEDIKRYTSDKKSFDKMSVDEQRGIILNVELANYNKNLELFKAEVSNSANEVRELGAAFGVPVTNSNGKLLSAGVVLQSIAKSVSETEQMHGRSTVGVSEYEALDRALRKIRVQTENADEIANEDLDAGSEIVAYGKRTQQALGKQLDNLLTVVGRKTSGYSNQSTPMAFMSWARDKVSPDAVPLESQDEYREFLSSKEGSSLYKGEAEEARSYMDMLKGLQYESSVETVGTYAPR